MSKGINSLIIEYLWRFTLLCLLCFSLPTYANSGVNWLVNQAQSDGQYSTANDLLAPFVATPEASGNTLADTLLAGSCQIHALLLSPEGELVTETKFEINAGDDTILGLRATTDKPRYNTTDVVKINALLQNDSTNVLIENALLNFTSNGTE